MRPFFLIISLILLLASCQNEPRNPQNFQKNEALKTPETVARQWQNHIDKNEFAQAQKLSTLRGRQWISVIQTFLEEENMDSLVTKTEFLNMKCSEKGADAFCVYLFKGDEGDIFQDTFFLKKENNSWLVDIPEDEGIPTEEEFIEFFEESEK